MGSSADKALDGASESQATPYSLTARELNSLDEGVSAIRETLKWAMAAFGATGAAVLAGLSIAGIAAANDPDLLVACISAVAAVGGVLLSIAIAARALAGSSAQIDAIISKSWPKTDWILGNTNKAVRRRLNQDPGLLYGRR